MKRMYHRVKIIILSRSRSAIRSALVIFSVIVMLSAACVGTQHQDKKTDAWGILKGYRLSSVACSPKGNYVAFVATRILSGDGEMNGPDHASIWLLETPEQGKTQKLKRLIRLTREQGIPVALFWLDGNKIGWAAARSDVDYRFQFMVMDLQGNKPRRLTNRSYSFYQDRAYSPEVFGAPEDAYWDSESNSILFSGEPYIDRIDDYSSTANVLNIPSGKIRKMPLGNSETRIEVLTLCGSLRNPQKPEFYIAANVTTEDQGRWVLWQSDSYSLQQSRVIAKSQAKRLAFPRTSPSGEALAWLQASDKKEMTHEIVVCNLTTSDHRIVATLSSDWEGMDPALGCPYSWSPDGKEIAYADKSRIKVISVTSTVSN